MSYVSCAYTNARTYAQPITKRSQRGRLLTRGNVVIIFALHTVPPSVCVDDVRARAIRGFIHDHYPWFADCWRRGQRRLPRFTAYLGDLIIRRTKCTPGVINARIRVRFGVDASLIAGTRCFCWEIPTRDSNENGRLLSIAPSNNLGWPFLRRERVYCRNFFSTHMHDTPICSTTYFFADSADNRMTILLYLCSQSRKKTRGFYGNKFTRNNENNEISHTYLSLNSLLVRLRTQYST